jgi:hypothetical protein
MKRQLYEQPNHVLSHTEYIRRDITVTAIRLSSKDMKESSI